MDARQTDAARAAGTPSDDAAIKAARASSFGSQAAAYAQMRPDYPDDAVRWALAPLADRTSIADRRPRILDLGAGTGKLTESLLRVLPGGDALVAVEPDPNMLAELRSRYPGVRAESGSAEAIPLPDQSVDAILVGQAMHWFDMPRALPEMARVLTPGGMLAGLWNLDDDRVPWVHEMKATARSQVSFARWVPGELPLVAGGHFAQLEHAQFPHGRSHTADSLAATIGTQSHVLILDDAARERLLGDVRDYLRSTPETAHGSFTLPMVTTVLRARKPR